MAGVDLAGRLNVTAADVARWIDAGMPTLSNKRIDPFAAFNWLCWGHLDECPILSRRWQTYLSVFEPFLQGNEQPRRCTYQRTHRIFLGERPKRVEWFLPQIQRDARQVDVHERPYVFSVSGRQIEAQRRGHWSVLEIPAETGESPIIEATGVATMRLISLKRIGRDHPDWKILNKLVEDLAGSFRYEYRHHAPWRPLSKNAAKTLSGSCLDCALLLGQRLEDIGRKWRLRTGIIAKNAVANPHFWVEADSTVGWVPLDPSVPAIARMLGQDWRAYATAFTGAFDASRIQLAGDSDIAKDVVGGPTVDSAIGEVTAIGADGTKANAWQCIDWVCGDCQAEFTFK
jgi:hypothetical protein